MIGTDYLNKEQDVILNEYPFMQCKHDNYLLLNGIWDLNISKNADDFNFQQKVLVPAPIESVLSRVNKRIAKNDYLIYHTHFKVKKSFIKDITKIFFLGVDQEYTLIFNGVKFDKVTPLSLITTLDISSLIKEENDLICIVKDSLDINIPYGKQVYKPHTMWYTPISGIYYPVMIESYSKDYIEKVKYTTHENKVTITINSNSSNFHLIIKDKEREQVIIDQDVSNISEITIADPHYWSVDHPFLYDVEISTEDDKITSYFALRDISLNNGFIYLNQQKVLLKAVLDQGYNPDGLYTPPSYKLYEDDILRMKALGFNTLRKHIKVELPYFYYLCDKLGMMVMQDFVNVGHYSYFRDSVLPTIGIQYRNDILMNVSPRLRDNFKKHYEGLIHQLYNHPSVILYTIFNEGWGQHIADVHYLHCKELDATRLFNTASGWYKPRLSDFNSEHEYFFNIKKLAKFNKPILLSEFGGFVFKVKDHLFKDDEEGYGYKYYDDPVKFKEELNQFFQEKIIPYEQKLVGFVYTQLSDVETEFNGLYTYDRKIKKVDDSFSEIIKSITNQ